MFSCQHRVYAFHYNSIFFQIFNWMSILRPLYFMSNLILTTFSRFLLPYLPKYTPETLYFEKGSWALWSFGLMFIHSDKTISVYYMHGVYRWLTLIWIYFVFTLFHIYSEGKIWCKSLSNCYVCYITSRHLLVLFTFHT